MNKDRAWGLGDVMKTILESHIVKVEGKKLRLGERKGGITTREWMLHQTGNYTLRKNEL